MKTTISTQIGMNTFSSDVEAFIPKLAVLGYSHIYFSGRLLTQSEEYLERIAALCDRHEIVPFAAHAPGQFLPKDETGLSQTLERHKQVIDKAALLNCNSVTFHVASVEGVRNEETGQFIEQIGMRRFDEMNFHMVRELAYYAEKKQIRIAVENLSRDIVANYCRTMDDLKRIIHRAGHPNVGICIDTGHANISGLSAAELILEAGDLLIETHFNDNFGWICSENAINDIHRPPGIGTVNWLHVIDALNRIGYGNPIIFELGFKGGEDTLDSFLRLAYDNWQSILQVWHTVKSSLSTI